MRLQTARAAAKRLEQLVADGEELTRQLGDDLRERYRRVIEHLEAKSTPAFAGRSQLELQRIRRELAHAQRQVLLDLHRRAQLDNDIFRQLERELDLQEQ